MIDSTTIAGQLAPVIDTLATKLKMPAKFIFDAYVRQAQIDGILGISFLLIPIALWIFLRREIRSVQRKIDKQHAEEAAKKVENPYYSAHISNDVWDESGAHWILLIAALITSVLAVIVVYLTIGGLLNPEYSAISAILSEVRGK